MADLESVWEHREEVVYRDLFGDIGQGIFALSPDTFKDGFNRTAIDPRWMHYGVFESAPNDKHSTWLYVTSGMSNPWDEEPSDYASSEWSGLGMEFVIETAGQSRWAIILLHRMMAYNILLSVGHFGDKPLLGHGNRIGTGNSIIIGQPSDLTVVAFVRPDHYLATFTLDSGSVEFLQLIGLTATELDYAKANSTDAVAELLKSKGAYPTIDPSRKSVI